MSSRSLPPPESVEAPPTSAGARRRNWLPTRPAWFAGFNGYILDEVSSEWTRWDTIGMLIAALCVLGGIAAALAVGLVLAQPAAGFWWVGLLWGVLLVCVERVVLQMPSADRWWATLGGIAWRLALSLAIAGLITEPLILRFSEKEVNAQVHQEVRIAKEKASAEVREDFEPLLKEARTKRRETWQRESDLEQKLAADEAQIAHAIADGNAAGRIAAEAHVVSHTRLLDKATARNEERHPRLNRRIDHLQEAQAQRELGAEKAIEEGIGFQARVAALAGVVERWPDTEVMVWLLRAVFVLLDLTPLVAVLAYRARRGKKPYFERLEMAHEWDALPAFRMEQAIRVERRRIKEEARRDMRLNQARIANETDQEIYGGSVAGNAGFSGAAAYTNMPLDEFAPMVEDIERRAVDVPDVLGRRARFGFAWLAASTLIALVLGTVVAVSATWLLILATAVTAALCLYTRGFSRAPVWAMQPILWTFVGGFSLPALVAILNLI